MKINTICVLGGTGFVGRTLVARLAGGGHKVKVLSRHRERHKDLIVLPNADVVQADIRDPNTLHEQFSGCDAVINLVGILNGSSEAFRAVHVQLPQRVVEACRQAGVKRLLHMSALNADAANGPSEYLRTKGEGEKAAHQADSAGIPATCFRPSIIFGPEDSFFNRFAGLLKLSPVLPLACPDARFAPVYIGDVAQAFQVALDNESTFGADLELCGPRTYTLKELVEYTARLIERRRLVIGLPDKLARLQGRILQHVPGQPFTMDNYYSLQVDSVCRSDGLAALGITPRSVEAIMPRHFAGKNQRGHYRHYRRQARRE